MKAAPQKNIMGIVMNYLAVSAIDTNGDFDAFRYKNCLDYRKDAGKDLYKHRRHRQNGGRINGIPHQHINHLGRIVLLDRMKREGKVTLRKGSVAPRRG